MRRSSTRPATMVATFALSLGALLGGCSPPDSPPLAGTEVDPVRAQRLFNEAEDLRYRYEAPASLAAIESYRVALEIWKAHSRPENACRAARRLGTVQVQIGQLNDAIESYREALELSRKADSDRLFAEILAEIGLVHAMVGDIDRATNRCGEALSLARDVGAVVGEAEALFCLAEVENHQGRLEEAANLHLQALSLWKSLSDERGEARAQLYLGTIYYQLSELDQAESCLNAAQEKWETLEDKRGRARTFVAWGHLYRRRGEYQIALNSYNTAKKLVDPMGDAVWQASLLDGIGSVYTRMAEYPDAVAYFNKALELYEQAGLTTEMIDAHLSLGMVYLAERSYDCALERFERALSASDDLGDTRLSAWALTLIGLIHQSENGTKKADPKRALDHYRRSLELQLDLDDPRLASETYGNQGVVHLALGQTNLAFDCFTKALELSRSAGDRLAEAGALYNLARAYRASGNIDKVREHLEASLETAEGLRAGVYSHVLRTSYLASIQRYYEFYIDLLMDSTTAPGARDADALAFQVSERARARSLLDSLAEGGVDIRQGVDPALVRRERRLKQQIDERSARWDRAAADSRLATEAAALAEEVRALSAEYDQVQAEIRSRSPHYAALTQPSPLSLADAQQQLLDEETLVLEYSLGEERSFLWAVERHRHASFELVAAEPIEKLSNDLYEMLTARIPRAEETVREHRKRLAEADARYWEVAAKLSDMLLGKVADRLGDKRIVVVSDGALQYLPFGALPVPGRAGDPVPMIAEHEIVNLPSVTVLSLLRSESRGRREHTGSVAVLADPVYEIHDPRLNETATEVEAVPGEHSAVVSELPGSTERGVIGAGSVRGTRRVYPRLESTRREADAILDLAPEGTTFRALDFEASRATATSADLGQYRIVHFATHGVVDNEHPRRSGIVLSLVDERGIKQNGFLRLNDIYNLDLRSELVVLSACDTALGKPVDGEGLVGLVRGFMYAGSPRVVASLWKVNDEATSELMIRFYRQMFRENKTPAAALREAQISMWREEEWRMPYFWAAFVLQGDWR